jgi:alpha-beta hydrolase superfamily lysophospholipase
MFYKILKKPFFGNFMVKWRNPLSEIEQKDWKNLEIKSKSGAILRGLFAEATNGKAKATIVLGHPMGKEAKGYFIKNGYTDLLRSNGFNTLVFDINGFGESSHGNFNYFDDIVAVGIEAQKLTPKLPIGYHGISLGGQFSTISFADETHRYKFAIVESAATTLPEFWIIFPFAYKTLKVLNFLLPRYSRRINMLERIKEAKHLNSLLLIYSKKDTWTPVEMGEKFKKNSPIPTEIWMVEEAEHAAIMKSKHKVEYAKKIINFFDDAVEKFQKGDPAV